MEERKEGQKGRKGETEEELFFFFRSAENNGEEKERREGGIALFHLPNGRRLPSPSSLFLSRILEPERERGRTIHKAWGGGRGSTEMTSRKRTKQSGVEDSDRKKEGCYKEFLCFKKNTG